MTLMTIIGTRPQYIKLKPLHDYCKKNNINNYIVDTKQHYSNNVSEDIIKELDLNINKFLDIDNHGDLDFLSKSLSHIVNIVKEINPKKILVMGDTNSALSAAIVANKLGIKLGHIESGVRCGDRSRPEEINRILIDELSDVHFVTREKDKNNVRNPILVGDLEYEFLNGLDINISYEDWILMTIHRNENVNFKKIKEIFDFCSIIKKDIIFPIHHRTKKYIYEMGIAVPTNIKTCEPKTYLSMIYLLSRCGGIITDSGGVSKISPFFGKKSIIFLEKVEWVEVLSEKYGINYLDHKWFDSLEIERNKNFYHVENSSKKIIELL